MKSIIKTLSLNGAILALALLGASCETSSPDASSAVTCDKCKTVWIQRPVQIGQAGKTGGHYVLRGERKMSCADCDAAATAFFRTGQLQHRCSHCGGALVHCSAH